MGIYVGDEHLDKAGQEAAMNQRDEDVKKSESGKSKDQGRPAPGDDSTARNDGKTGTYSSSRQEDTGSASEKNDKNKPVSGGPQSGGQSGAGDDGEYKGGRPATTDDKVPANPSQSGTVR